MSLISMSSPPIVDISPVLMVALSKRMEKMAKGVKVSPGRYPLRQRLILDLDLIVDKAKDVMQTPTVSIPLKAVLAIALQKAGIQRENISKILVDSMTEAIVLDEERAEELMQVTEDAMQRVSETLSKLPKVPRSGATKVEGTIGFLEVEPEMGVLRMAGVA